MYSSLCIYKFKTMFFKKKKKEKKHFKNEINLNI